MYGTDTVRKRVYYRLDATAPTCNNDAGQRWWDVIDDDTLCEKTDRWVSTQPIAHDLVPLVPVSYDVIHHQ